MAENAKTNGTQQGQHDLTFGAQLNELNQIFDKKNDTVIRMQKRAIVEGQKPKYVLTSTLQCDHRQETILAKGNADVNPTT